jgi:hypothetical protein
MPLERALPRAPHPGGRGLTFPCGARTDVRTWVKRRAAQGEGRPAYGQAQILISPLSPWLLQGLADSGVYVGESGRRVPKAGVISPIWHSVDLDRSWKGPKRLDRQRRGAPLFLLPRTDPLKRLREIRDQLRLAEALIPERDELIRRALREGSSERKVAAAIGLSQSRVGEIGAGELDE